MRSSQLLYKLLLLFTYATLFGTPTLLAQSTCTSDQYETENEDCYPVWYGETESGAYYTIVIPDDWTAADGLVFWNHGFQSFLTGFETNDLLDILNPLWEGFYTGAVQDKPGLGPYGDYILTQGYAMAASSYSQTGWAVFDSHISNGELYNAFLSIVNSLGQGAPEQFYIIGGSLGGIVTMRDLESDQVPDPDGALLLCGAVAGSVNWIDAYDLRTIYEAVCDAVPGAKLPKPWYERPELLFGELDYLDSLNECVGMGTRLLIDENDPIEVLAWEFEYPDEAERLEEILETSDTENPYFLALNLWYAIFQIPRLINDNGQLAGAIPFSNIGIDYNDGSVNQAALRNFALPSSFQSLLANYTPNGNIGNTKIVSIHTSHDGLVRVQNQYTLQTLIPANQLTVAIVDDSESPSHCGFTIDEGLAAWNELTDWVSGETQPSVIDLELACLATASDEDNCNYDPDLVVVSGLPTFKRENSIGVTGVNTYDAATGQLEFQSLQLLGADETYDGVLNPPASNSSLFTLGEIVQTGSTPVWQHSSAFDADSSLLYLPRVNILNVAPPDTNAYDVYLRFDGVDSFEFVEFEQK
ncbi:MAG: hypothetical protein OXU66_01425 [Gammaproteobacteria bacterium]|nr:hypothetical protein [Gammaproteobacteria bacterium]MDD9895408.1 hypothetical protein [Gammaproteobacteria bacterium]MDD9957575.1 hypothetical protein [Gammaproteobacteria bacterium]